MSNASARVVADVAIATLPAKVVSQSAAEAVAADEASTAPPTSQSASEAIVADVAAATASFASRLISSSVAVCDGGPPEIVPW
jgi:hypothetical protein